MFLELIAAFVAGLGAAGLVLVLNLITKGRLPRWAMPVAAGAAMIAVGIGLEYSWADRTAQGLPEGVVVIEEVTQTAWWRPWTYLVPQTVRLVALDTQSVRTREDAPNIRLVDLYLFARWQPPASAPQFVRCGDDPARADVTDAALADPAAATWRAAGDDLIRLACKG